MKKDQYFNLEVNFLSNDNIVRMMMELDAAQSLGIYMMLLTHLRKADNYEASCCPLCMGAFARMYDLDADVLQRVLREFDLFVLDEERQMFRSPFLQLLSRTPARREVIAEIQFHIPQKQQAIFPAKASDMLFKSSDHLLLPLHEKFAHTGVHSHRLHVTFRFGHLIHQHLPRKNRL